MIDPEFWSDEEIGHWSHAARLFYIGLWNFADDKGRFKAHNNLLKSQIYPYDLEIDINKLKKELMHKIQWYEVDGLQYGYIKNFLKHQRIDKPTDSKLPPPPREIGEGSAKPQGGLPPNIIEVNISEVKLRELLGSGDSAFARQLQGLKNLESLLSRWGEAFKDISLSLEFKKMSAWYEANPQARKKNLPRFINAWLGRAGKDGKNGSGQHSLGSAPKAEEGKYAGVSKVLES
jgi:hypothetical protein